MITRKNILYFLLAIIVFIGFVLARIPAGLALGYAAKKTGMIIPYQAVGTFWRGSASDITINYGNGAVSLGHTEWSVAFLPLLAGKLSVSLESIKEKQKITGDFTVGSGSYLAVQDAEISVAAATLAMLSPVPLPGQVDGVVELSLADFEFDGGVVEELDGVLVVRDAIYTLGSPLVLGTYAAKLSVKDKLVTAILSDIDATVAVNGEANLLPETKKYTANINFMPKPDANPFIVQALAAFAQKKPDGSFQLVR